MKASVLRLSFSLALAALLAACGRPAATPTSAAAAPAAAPTPVAAPRDPDIVASRSGHVKVVQHKDGTWQMLVDDKPFFIKGVVFTPVKIGESPGDGTMRDWMLYDDDKDGRNDPAFQSWVDANRNNRRDPGETEVGDFQLLKEMGVNTIRLYHLPSRHPEVGDMYRRNPSTAIQFDHDTNKDLLRKLYRDYGIRVVMGNFMGSWTIGSGASWDEGTDYTNPEHRKKILASVKAMVLEHKDEPYVLMWFLGNENNIATWSRCDVPWNPEAWASLVGEAARLIHQLDPEHPVAVSEGDDHGWGNNAYIALEHYGKLAPEVDIVAYNSYRGKNGLGDLWDNVKRIFDRPVFISECGMFAYQKAKGPDEKLQLEFDQGYWRDIVQHSGEAMHRGDGTTGNAIGVTFFDWIDRWYLDESPAVHNPGDGPWECSPDSTQHEEWYGRVSMGNGSDWLMRQKRPVYDYFARVWNKSELAY